MPWKQWFTPLEPRDPRNVDREDPGGERIRSRLNIQRGQVVDFLVQYETPIEGMESEHLPVIRFDGSHGRAHYHVLAVDGSEVRRHALPEHLNYNEAVDVAFSDIKRNWRHMRFEFLRGKR